MPHLPDDNAWLLAERKAIGDRIRVERLRQNRTQESIFLAARVGRTTYQGVEAGTLDARIGTLLRIARVLGIHPADLLR
ncbi:helix-turn-helix transcriptional regulator [Streptomyces sp. NPDC001634]|uniref:helix-turn-helix domain-containing protein n=1 Tax=Streptomyces sp. NPDC001634 TaxID=3154390 RepID=UPI00332670DD